jgi:hypothetical protein
MLLPKARLAGRSVILSGSVALVACQSARRVEQAGFNDRRLRLWVSRCPASP